MRSFILPLGLGILLAALGCTGASSSPKPKVSADGKSTDAPPSVSRGLSAEEQGTKATGPSSSRKLSADLEGSILVQRNARGTDASVILMLKNVSRASSVQLLSAYYPQLEGGGDSGIIPVGARPTISFCPRATSTGVDIEQCTGHARLTEHAAPLNSLLTIDPGVEVSLAFPFAFNPSSKAPMYTFSGRFIYRSVADLRKDEMLTEKEKRSQLKTMSISFPQVPVAEAQ